MKRKALALAIVVLTLWVATPLKEAPVPPTLPKEKCFWGEFDSLNAYHEVKGPARAFVDIEGGKVRVYENCRGT